MPFCDQCGERISEQARFCPNCGARRWTPRTSVGRPRHRRSPPPPASEPPRPRKPPAPAPPRRNPGRGSRLRPSRRRRNGRRRPRASRGKRRRSRPRAARVWGAAPPPRKPPRRSPRRPGRRAPEQELYAALGAQLRTPPVVSAGIIGAGALGVCFAVALVLAALPDRSLIGFLGSDATYLEETFRQMCQLVLAGFENDAAVRHLPPDRPRRAARLRGGAARRTFLLARGQRPRLATLAFWPRLAWAAAGGLVFALLMLVPSLLTGDIDPTPARSSATRCCGASWARSRGHSRSVPRAASRPGRSTRACPDRPGRAAAAWTALKPWASRWSSRR